MLRPQVSFLIEGGSHTRALRGLPFPLFLRRLRDRLALIPAIAGLIVGAFGSLIGYGRWLNSPHR